MLICADPLAFARGAAGWFSKNISVIEVAYADSRGKVDFYYKLR